MKQKRLEDILYVFDVNPYEITQDTDAEVIKVQEESYKGFVEMNPDLAGKIVRFNYHVICVNTPEWAPYVDEEDPQEQLTFGIYGSAAVTSIAQVQRQDANNNILETWVAGVGLTFPFQASFNEGEHFAVEFVNGVNPDLLNITGDALSIGWIDQDTSRYWKATPALSASTSVGIDAASPATYKLYLSENATSQGITDENLRVTTNSVQVALEDLVAGIDVAEDTLVEVWLLTEDASNYNTSSISQWMNLSTENGLHYWRNMPAEDKTIEINLVQTVTISGDAPLAYIKELTSDKSTTVNTYANPTLPVTLTVTYHNILALSAGSSEDAPKQMYAITPNIFATQIWTDPATGDKCNITPPIRQDKSCEILQKYTLTIDGSNIDQNVTVKIDGETVQSSYYPNVVNGTVVDIYPTGNVADYVLQSGAVWDTDHWTATVNGADLTITINYLGAGVNFNASWGGSMNHLENVSQINIGNTSVTGSDLTDTSWAETVRLYPGQSQIKYFITTGLPTDMNAFIIEFAYQVDDHIDGEEHFANKRTDPDTGEVFYIDGNPIVNQGVWTYDNTPETGLPWIAFTLPSTDIHGNAFPANADMRIAAVVSGS